MSKEKNKGHKEAKKPKKDKPKAAAAAAKGGETTIAGKKVK